MTALRKNFNPPLLFFVTSELRDTFQLFNKDGDGVISLKEVTTVLLSLGQDPTSSDVQSLIQPFDTDGM